MIEEDEIMIFGQRYRIRVEARTDTWDGWQPVTDKNTKKEALDTYCRAKEELNEAKQQAKKELNKAVNAVNL